MSYTKQEYYETGDDTNSTGGQGANIFGGQTFTPQVSHTITKVGVLASKAGSPSGNGYIDLYLCNQTTHLPIGNRLARATYGTSSVIAEPAKEWLEILLDTPVALTAGTEYVLTFSQPNSNGSNKVMFRSDGSSPTYTRGVMIFTNTGWANFAVYATYDYLFREYSSDIPGGGGALSQGLLALLG